ncbi:MAG TPA: hypothetical protein VFK60_11355 [Casimicrobiaceae bacterium]|nr:hypothetical protein [Casimicrobiaceae bacterium]
MNRTAKPLNCIDRIAFNDGCSAKRVRNEVLITMTNRLQARQNTDM